MMSEQNKTEITVEAVIEAPVEKAWEFWTRPDHIIKWNQASDDWHTTHSENDLRPGGKFVSRMEAKDGSAGFDFGGIYDEIIEHEAIVYTMQDGRKVKVCFSEEGNTTHVTETFDLEDMSSHEMEQNGWQAILNSFKKYAETAINEQ